MTAVSTPADVLDDPGPLPEEVDPAPDHRMCASCRRALYKVLWTVGRHTGCTTPEPLSADSFDRLARYVADVIGAQPTTTEREVP